MFYFQVRGWQVSPYELESSIISGVPGVEDCAVVGMERGEAILPYAFVLGKQIDTYKVLAHVKGWLENEQESVHKTVQLKYKTFNIKFFFKIYFQFLKKWNERNILNFKHNFKKLSIGQCRRYNNNSQRDSSVFLSVFATTILDEFVLS